MHTAPKAIVTELIRAAAAASGNASMRFAANGAMRSRGYAGKIQIGVMLWIGKVLRLILESAGVSRTRSYCVDQRIRYMPELASTAIEA
jgi:hypothetical protein